MNIVNNSAITNGTKQKLAQILHKNGKRDWMYDAMEETVCHKISVNQSTLQLKAEDKTILSLGNETNRSHQPHTHKYI